MEKEIPVFKMLRLPNIEDGFPASKLLLPTALVVAAQSQMIVLSKYNARAG